jgi:hypothetical protein
MHFEWGETGGLLNEAHQLNWHFGDIKKDFIEQIDHLLYNWDPLDCKKMKIFELKWFILTLFLSWDTCAGYEFMLMQEVGEALSSDNQMLCFRRKAYCKSDKAVRLPRF